MKFIFFAAFLASVPLFADTVSCVEDHTLRDGIRLEYRLSETQDHNYELARIATAQERGQPHPTVASAVLVTNLTCVSHGADRRLQLCTPAAGSRVNTIVKIRRVDTQEVVRGARPPNPPRVATSSEIEIAYGPEAAFNIDVLANRPRTKSFPLASCLVQTEKE